MSKATSLNNIEYDPNVSNEIDNVLAEIESSKHNQVPPQQMAPPSVQMPPNQGQQIPPQQYQQMPRDLPPTRQAPQQVPEQVIMDAPKQMMAPNFYQPPQNTSGGILDFLQSFMIIGDELKWVAIIAGLFVIMSSETTIGLIAKYLSFTVNEIGVSTIIGNVTRGLILSLLFVLINKFI